MTRGALGGIVPVLEIGGTHVTGALVDTGAQRVLEGSRRSEPLHADAPAAELLGTVLECAEGIGAPAGAHWGVAVPGPFDYARGIARFTGVGKFDALSGVDLRRALLERLPPGARVGFLNDAHAFALGEWVAGAAEGHRRVVGITLGTGVGSAFLAGGALVDDTPEVPPEGHVHLLTHAGRPLEETVSRRALLRRYAELTGGAAGPGGTEQPGGVDIRDIADRARAGEEAARRVLDEALRVLGAVLRPWVSGFRATALVVGGSIAGSWSLIAEPLRAGLGLPAAPGAGQLEVARARHLVDAPLLGAAWQTLPDRGAAG